MLNLPKRRFVHNLTCKKCERKFQSIHSTAMYCNSEKCKYKRTCLACNVNFRTNDDNAKLCKSKKCKLTINCEICKTDFQTRNISQKKCSTCKYTLVCKICKNQFMSNSNRSDICSSKSCEFTIKCIVCKKKFKSKNQNETICFSEKCAEKQYLLEIQEDCPDPVVRGRLRDDSLENVRMGTAWGIRKIKLPKHELEKLKEKFEPDRYGIVSEKPKSKVRRRPKDSLDK
jgi:hypothetical protein